MADSGIEVRGVDQLAEGTRKLADKIERSSVSAFADVADQRAGRARAAMPRVSGALAASVTTRRAGDRAQLGFGGPDVPYAGWIEWGGVREGGRNSWASRPYLPGGRYFWPSAIGAAASLQAAGTKTASNEIRRMRWPSPKE